MTSQRYDHSTMFHVRASFARYFGSGASALDVAACGIFAVLFGALSLKLRHVSLWLALLAVGVAYPVADLVSGVVHWAADTWGSPSTPIIGSRLIAPFREHHRNPEAMLAHGFVAASGATCLLALPIATAALWFPSGHGVLGPATTAFVWGLLLFVALTNQFHAWAHAKSPPPLVAWLQRHRLILEPVHHDAHHMEQVKNYCVTSGWLNPLLEECRFFSRLERVVTTLTGLKPQATTLPRPPRKESRPRTWRQDRRWPLPTAGRDAARRWSD